MRVVRIGKDAIYELLRETFLDHAANIFDLLDITKVQFEMKWDTDTEEFTCIAFESDGLPYGAIDFERLHSEIELTAQSVYVKHPYVSVQMGDYTQMSES